MRFLLYPFILLLFILPGCKTDYRPSDTYSSYTVLHDSLRLTDKNSSEIIRPYKDSVDKVMNEIVGSSSMQMFTAKPQGTLGNFVADLLYYDIPLMKDYYFLNYNPSFAMINTRGLRARMPEGEITVGKIYEIMPFENKIVIVKMPAESFSNIGLFLVASGGHPVSKNISLVGGNGKLDHFSVNDRQPTGYYYIITTDYLASGGDNMEFFSRAIEIIDTGILLRNQIIDHFKKLTSKNKKAEASIDERIILFR